MAVKKLSKSEYKYRYKYFYENHLGKAEQLVIDKLVQANPEISYKTLYNIHNSFKFLDEVADKIAKLDEYGISIDRAKKAFHQAAQQSADVPLCMD